LLEYKKELITGGILFVCALILLLILPDKYTIGWIVGYLLGFLAVLLHLFVVLFTGKLDDESFLYMYYTGIVLRFLIVLALFITLLAVTEIDQIAFTISFIISYIPHSVIEIILINKLIDKNARKDFL
jgi:F0F1-type ATP synthase assembly protein I